MIVFLLAALFGFLLFGSAGNCIASGDLPWQKIDEGFEYKAVRVEGPPYQSFMKMAILRIGFEQFQVRIMDSRNLGMDRMEIKALTRKAQALAGINGGFFLPGYRPLGLLIVDGKETNPLRKADWGVFLVQDERPRIIHTTEYQNDGNITQALQVGPRLVVNGRELQMKRQIARRSALGVTLKNQVILLTTEDTDVYAQDLAHFFHLPEARGGLECRDAMALDGGPSAQMYAEYKDLRIHIPGGWGVPNGVGVFKRKQP
jgi:uncharacterized protein YigE (DUF2233 family)